VGLELNKVTVPVEAMGRTLAQARDQNELWMTQARASLESHAQVTDELRRKIRLACEVDASWRGAVPLGDRLNERRPFSPEAPSATLIAVDGSQIYPDRHGIALYYLLNIGGITLRQNSGTAPATDSQPSLFFAQDELYDEKGRLRNVEHINMQRDRCEIETLASLVERERKALGGEFSRPILALVDGPLLFWAPSQVGDHEGQDETQRQLEHFTRQLSRLRSSRAVPIGYVDRPISANVLRTLDLADLAPEQISRESVRRRRHELLVDRMLFASLRPGERSGLFASTAVLNDEYAREGHRIVFFYANMARHEGGEHAIIARIDLPEWAVQDQQNLDQIMGALYADCALTGVPYVLIRAHELAVVTSVERAEFERLLGQQMIRNGLSPQLSAKAANKQLISRRGRRR
jgi:NurA domain